jgi:hypothetical protein
MATFVWTGQGTDGSNNITIDASDKIGFYGSAFGNAITVGQYQDTTHNETSGGAHDCPNSNAVHLHNVKYLTGSTFALDGGSSETLNGTNLTTAECTLKINFSHGSSVATSAATFWAYDGTTDSAVPTDVTFQCAEQGDTAWSNAEGSGAAMTLDDNTTSTSHDYFLALSASPESVGDKTAFALKIQLTYQ